MSVERNCSKHGACSGRFNAKHEASVAYGERTKRDGGERERKSSEAQSQSLGRGTWHN
jgi:hypothetical protein